MSKTLIVYYSRKGENYVNGSVRNLPKGNTRPELKTYPDSLDGYDTIFVGYPNWWGTMPMAMFTFLEHFDLSGKRILPFCTNEGSGMGSSERDLKKVCKGAKVESGLSIHGAEAANSRSKVESWVRKLV